MFYKGIIFDIDNTLYNYDLCHRMALNETFSYIIQNNDCCEDYEILKSYYDDISQKIKCELYNTASSHNKGIYFKQLIEKLNMNMKHFKQIHETYWNVFYDNIKCIEGVLEFVIWNYQKGIKLGILSDYETEYQIHKLEKIGLLPYIETIVSSEEVGIEKPSCKMFYTILSKMNLDKSDVIMIGDNYNKDIIGSSNMGILSFWYNILSNDDIQMKREYFTFNNYITLLNFMKEQDDELSKLVKISKLLGERFDLVQAGGGNSSVKINDLMYIKASGYNMSNINNNNGYVLINNKRLHNDIRDDCVNDNLTKYNVIGTKRSSIETMMHAILKKYTIHIHPIQLNRILISSDATDLIKQIYPTGKIIKYCTPGISLCNEINKTYKDENVIFLLNHGVIITSNDFDELSEILDEVCCKFEIFQGIDYTRYKYTNTISNFINTIFNTTNVSYLCEDQLINEYLIDKKYLFDLDIAFPDVLVYCGMCVLYDMNKIQEYTQKYKETPKLIIVNNNLYINNLTLSKCKDTEDVLKSNLMILDSDYRKTYLSNTEIQFLNNWDSEKYRQKL